MRTTYARSSLRGLFVFLALAVGIAFAAVASAQTTATIPTSADGATASGSTAGICVGCSVTDADNVVSVRRNAPATIAIPIGVLSSAEITVEMPDVAPKRSRAGFVVTGGSGILDIGVLNRTTVRTYRDGALVDEATGTSLLRVLDVGAGRQSVSFRSSGAFDAMQIEVAGAVALLTDVDVLWSFYIEADPLSPIFARAADGATVTSGTSGLCLGCSVTNEAAVIDNARGTAGEISVPVGLAASARFTVGYGQVLPARAWTGFFLTANQDLLSLSVLGGLTLTTYRNGVEVDSETGAGLRVTEQNGYSFVRFRSSGAFDTVRISWASLAGVSMELNVHQAITVPSSMSLGDQVQTAGPAAGLDAEASTGAPVGLSAPAPNPFRGTSRLALTLEEAAPVRVVAYDALGREVAVLHDGALEAGTHALRFEAAGLAPGPYVVRVDGTAVSRTVTVAR